MSFLFFYSFFVIFFSFFRFFFFFGLGLGEMAGGLRLVGWLVGWSGDWVLGDLWSVKIKLVRVWKGV